MASMKNRENGQILELPYQTMYGEDLEDCNDPEIIAFHVRLWATKMLNALQQGRLKPTEQNIQKLQNLNKSLRSLGKPELPIDF